MEDQNLYILSPQYLLSKAQLRNGLDTSSVITGFLLKTGNFHNTLSFLSTLFYRPGQYSRSQKHQLIALRPHLCSQLRKVTL